MGLFIGDAQPSKIFVGDTPISKVFLGDTQIRSATFEYSVDFRTKTLAELKDEGWYVIGGDNNVYLNSNGYSCQTHGSGNLDMDIDLSSAKKITMKSLCYHVSDYWNGVSLFDFLSGGGFFQSGHYSNNYANYSGYGIMGSGEGYADTSTAVRGAFGNGDYNVECVRDLENKTGVLTGFPQNVTRQLSDNDIAAIRNSTGIELQSLSPQIIRTFEIKVEY